MKLRITLAILIAGCLSLCSGTTLWDNGGPDGVSGNEMSSFLQADDFLLGGLSNLTGFVFASLELSEADYRDSISWSIRGNAGGAPGAEIAGGNTAAVGRSLLGFVTIAGNEYALFANEVSISVAGLAGGTYWLGLHNGTLGETDPGDFLWASTGPNATFSGHEFDLLFGSDWAPNFNEHAFAIFGDLVGPPPPPGIPEPAAFVLMGSGLMGLALLRRRRARS